MDWWPCLVKVFDFYFTISLFFLRSDHPRSQSQVKTVLLISTVNIMHILIWILEPEKRAENVFCHFVWIMAHVDFWDFTALAHGQGIKALVVSPIHAFVLVCCRYWHKDFENMNNSWSWEWENKSLPSGYYPNLGSVQVIYRRQKQNYGVYCALIRKG